MDKKYTILLFFFISIKAFTQSCITPWNTAKSCMVNVNSNNFDYYNTVKRSVFKMANVGDCGSCTGTLINRSVSEKQLAMDQYFITAWHCIVDFGISEGQTFRQDLYFNFQSSNNSSSSVPISNRGLSNVQSTTLSDQGYRYILRNAEIKLIAKVAQALGDFAVCQILTPIPPHYNVYYAGWTPVNTYAIASAPPYIGIHHPAGDIKKISATPAIIVPPSNPVAVGCRNITKVIDALFGWIWKRKVLTQVICNYVETPETNFYYISYWTAGTTEPGSSGSCLFNPPLKTIGTLSGGFAGCDFHTTDAYGRLGRNYLRQDVKNALNPAHTFTIDQAGLSGRSLSCYDNLNLSGYYFPAKDYQSNNNIILSASNNITTNGILNIFEGASFEFTAGNTIDLNNGFNIDVGASFDSKIQPCAPSGYRIGNLDSDHIILYEIASIELPEDLGFDENEYLFKDFQIDVFPNPTNGLTCIKTETENPENIKLSIFDIMGKKVFTATIDAFTRNFNVDFREHSAGIYQIELTSESGIRKSTRVIVAH